MGDFEEYGYDYDDMDDGRMEISPEELLAYVKSQGMEITPEIQQMLDSYQARYTSPTKIASRIPLSEVFENCIGPSGTQTVQKLLPLFLLCIVFRVVCQINNGGLRGSSTVLFTLHLCSSLFGIIILKDFFQMTFLYLVLCCGLSYFLFSLLCLFQRRKWCGLAAAIFIVLFTVSCELLFVPSKTWHQIRGAQIILSMKIISLASDVATNEVSDLPNVFEYMGYCFNVGTVIFGPWVSYEDYYKVIENTESFLDFRWLVYSACKTVCCGFCLLYSNCFTHWIILDHYWKWVLAYRDAQSFRFSHYFVSLLSDATASITGFANRSKDSFLQWNVVRPQNIELPRSIVEVVTNWNLPMHYWLKTYVFKSIRPHGTFLAVIVTYVASSMLHGLNFQLAAVLLSLGFYSYTEFVFRRRLSKIFDACIQAKKCKDKCDHMYTSNHPVVIIINLTFGCLAVFHLAYLGLMFDSSTEEDKGYTMWHTLDKWASLGYLSHCVVLGTFIFYWLI